jgi:hypothetical protein
MPNPRDETTADEAWKRQYTAEFVRYALTRTWTSENASVWADDGLTFGGRAPDAQAWDDVIACEWGSANAC